MTFLIKCKNVLNQFIEQWGQAAKTSLGFFWMALWAFALGYIVSSMIQIFVSSSRMQKAMGKDNAKSILLGTFFGFISSSCSFSALATSKSLFQKGASFVSSIAFLLASTNLVIELGIVISIFMGWQFVVGEYLGGVLLILISWLLIKLINPKKLIQQARKNMGEAHEHHQQDTSFFDQIKSLENWQKVGKKYGMEWKMVWKDVTVGFTIAGIISAFVPDSFFQQLFIGSGTDQANHDFLTVLQHVVVGPIAAFFTFIGSMGNIPLAALLFGKGVSFAGVIAFIFSDLVVFPVLRINAKYYGWKMSLFIVFLLFTSLVATSLILHYGFDYFDLIPQSLGTSIVEKDHFSIDYTFFLNIGFILLSGLLLYLGFVKKSKSKHHHHEMAPKSKYFEMILKYLALVSYVWLTVGIIISTF